MRNKVFPLTEKQTDYLITYVDQAGVSTVGQLFETIYKAFPGMSTGEYTEIAVYVAEVFGISEVS